jgi:hypothetical protein
MYHLWKGDYNEILESWHERYGGLVRIGPSHLSLGDPAEVSKVYLSNPALIKVRTHHREYIKQHTTMSLIECHFRHDRAICIRR